MLREIREQFAALNPGKRDLVFLGLLFGGVLIGLAAWSWYRGGTRYPWLAGAGALFVLWGLAWPHGMRPLYKAWMAIALVMGYFTSRICLALIYFFIVTPLGIIMRLRGKDLLGLKREGKRSFWIAREGIEYDPKTSEKMF